MDGPKWDKEEEKTEEKLIHTDHYAASYKYVEKVIEEEDLGYINEDGVHEISFQELDRALKKRDPHPEW